MITILPRESIKLNFSENEIWQNVKNKKFRERELACPKIDKWSILGLATVKIGKRQTLNSRLAGPTP